LGGVTFFLAVAVIAFLFLKGSAENTRAPQVLAVDAALLLLPHWLTGLRSIMTQPKLLLKTRLIQKLLQSVTEALNGRQVEYFMLLKGADAKVPEDVKFRIRFDRQHPDFLGFYGQIVTNQVQSNTYPYFYVVLVAKKGYGLKTVYHTYAAPQNLTKEYNLDGEVEVLVIRQTTTKTSGYHTKDREIRQILLEGLGLAERSAVRK
jgi:hypothetical protein